MISPRSKSFNLSHFGDQMRRFGCHFPRSSSGPGGLVLGRHEQTAPAGHLPSNSILILLHDHIFKSYQKYIEHYRTIIPVLNDYHHVQEGGQIPPQDSHHHTSSISSSNLTSISSFQRREHGYIYELGIPPNNYMNRDNDDNI